MADSMISTYRINALLYGIVLFILLCCFLIFCLVFSFGIALNCILDCAGAVWSIKSKELFEFQEIAQHHNDFQKTMAL
jgi:hypothetical protein